MGHANTNNRAMKGETLKKHLAEDPAHGGMETIGGVDKQSITEQEGDFGTLTLYYPTQNTLESAQRPQIRFSCIRKTFEKDGDGVLSRRSCYFPCPANIAFGDAANLSSIDLGTMGAAADFMANNEQTFKAGFATAFEGAAKALGSTILGGFDAATGGSVKKGQAIRKVATNPFTNTTFQGNNVRSFTFNFKLVASSQAEANMIKEIHNYFRRNMYGGAESFDQFGDLFNTYLSYPPIWEIDFLESVGFAGAKHNKYLPKIFASYLGSFNSTFNTTAAAWYHDGAPLEVDMSLTFQESRVLNYGDIVNLEKLGNTQSGDFDELAKRGISSKGTATAVTQTSDMQKEDFKERVVNTSAGLESAAEEVRAEQETNEG
jgi:hypothetical protein